MVFFRFYNQVDRIGLPEFEGESDYSILSDCGKDKSLCLTRSS